MEFMRNMFLIVVPQVLRMDPVIYAQMVGGRPDHTLWLISCLHIAKGILEDDCTQFAFGGRWNGKE